MIKLEDSIMSYKKPTTSNHSIMGFQLLKTYMYTPLKLESNHKIMVGDWY